MTAVLEFRGVSKTLRAGTRRVRALHDVSLAVAAGETLAVVGESGGGKTTLGRLALGLFAPDEGEVLLAGKDWFALSPAARRRCLRPQAIFQDPDTSLNPRWRAFEIVTEALRLAPRDGAASRSLPTASSLLEMVGLDPACARSFPHQLSGGQRQRLAIARAIAPRPDLIVADEPLASLDVVTAAHILALLRRLKNDLGTAFLFISHHLAWVSEIADRIAVLQRGELVECAPASRLLSAPQHPYTRQLVAASPLPLTSRI